MNERDYQLNQLVCKACACAASSPERQRCLDQLIRQLAESGRLWSRSDILDADFQDILQKAGSTSAVIYAKRQLPLFRTIQHDQVF